MPFDLMRGTSAASKEQEAVKPQVAPKQDGSAQNSLSLSSPEVKEMQEAMLHFGRVLYSFGARNKEDAQPNQQPSALVNFIEQKNPLKDKKRTLRDIVVSIGNIGGQKNQYEADGIWGQKTQAALAQIAQIIKQLQEQAKNLQIPLEGKGEIDEFLQKLSIHPESNKTEKADELTPLLNQVSRSFLKFRDDLASNKEAEQKLEQQNNKQQYQEQLSLSPEEQQFLEGHQRFYVPNLNQQAIMFSSQPVLLSDLSDMKKFKELLLRGGLKENDLKDKQKIMNVLNNLEKYLGQEQMSPQDFYQQMGY